MGRSQWLFAYTQGCKGLARWVILDLGQYPALSNLWEGETEKVSVHLSLQDPKREQYVLWN